MARRSWRIHLLKFEFVPSWGANFFYPRRAHTNFLSLYKCALRSFVTRGVISFREAKSALRSFSENRKRFTEKLCALRGILKVKKCCSRLLSEPAVLKNCPEGRTYTPPKGDVCALRGNEKATQFSERMQTAKYPVGRTAFRVSALLKVEMPKCASPKRGTIKSKWQPLKFRLPSEVKIKWYGRNLLYCFFVMRT